MEIEKIIRTKLEVPQQKAIVNIRYTSNYMANIHNEFMAEFNISMAQFNILRILRGAKEPLNVNTVKDLMIEKSPNTTRLMDKLKAKKMIKRTRCESDRRVVFLEITEMGLDLLAKIDVKLEKQPVFTPAISDEEAHQLSDLLDKVRENFIQL